MLVLGVILVAIAAALVVAALLGGRGIDEPAGFDLGAVEINPNTFSVFLTGAVTVVVLVIGLGLIQSGSRRARRRRQEKKELERLSKKEETRESAPTRTDRTTPAEETRTDTEVKNRDHPSS